MLAEVCRDVGDVDTVKQDSRRLSTTRPGTLTGRQTFEPLGPIPLDECLAEEDNVTESAPSRLEAEQWTHQHVCGAGLQPSARRRV